MAAPPADTWRDELVCDTAKNHARVCAILQNYLDKQDAYLDIRNKGIVELPPSYFARYRVCVTLRVFLCSSNRLAALPETFGRLMNLRELNCSNNRLTALPSGLGELSHLQYFNCSDNNLTSLPGELGQLSALEKFNCSHNDLTDLPAGLGQLSALVKFNCSYNDLTDLPAELGQLFVLEVLNCAGNTPMCMYFWSELRAHGDLVAYERMNPIDLATSWKARWHVVEAAAIRAARRIKRATP